MMTIKTKEEIALLREGGKILANVLDTVCSMVKVGITTGELEDKACEMIKQAGGRPAFKHYQTYSGEFPTALCTSINDEIVHGPAYPSRELVEGDIISIDIGMEYPLKESRKSTDPVNKHSELGGYYTDMARTVAVGVIAKETQDLMDATKKSLNLAIAQVKPGNKLSDIGRAVQSYVEPRGYAVVRDLVGHGVGHDVHEEPQVPNYVVKDGSMKDMTIKEGMVIAIEPMITLGDWDICTEEDGMTISTADGSLSAHYEHTLAVTEKGCIIITELEKNEQ